MTFLLDLIRLHRRQNPSRRLHPSLTATKAPKAKAKTKSESSSKAKEKTASAVDSDPGISKSRVVEPPSSHVAGAPEDEDIDDFPEIERLFEDCDPGVVEDPSLETVRSPSSSSKPKDVPAAEVPPEVPKSDDDKAKPPDSKASDKNARREAELRKEAKSVHHLLTDMPKNRFCPICQRAKKYKPPLQDRWVQIHQVRDVWLAFDLRPRHRVSRHRGKHRRVSFDIDNEGRWNFPHACLSVRTEVSGRKLAFFAPFVSNQDHVGTIYHNNAHEITGAIKDLG